ncbi:methyltransferase domain-containing protein [Haloferax mediterranei ATCC 33500]|uniref:Methyltransferase domain-containing protein n=1 Tax=Haloferax mediterranei (strain ATCC 33500 / DSM 1411 / JCM 8866 / NBRC 14739 / NCIMB 2177 / R-4) TaxID=523841 RepID=I3R4T6_HALMT|nr:METTL5 family protein [Haloferax mediterranei]AFK19246.1 putative RNA methylase [Haloferax mediterranei ATCC 33500]AHZ21395.1 RNA methyltransferase [Haloferax mediterranei ATCC 33500]EMA04566.1 putative RNA methylase [Haloferax mediterranei ATCC 33500]MDX5989348.1 METTL5 family protein [Haloferax mediterranei ATCC 33500]QCQ75713.1 methyltransferase domain-containing protein [Haloferax mediterranei ATCC 33500]
MATKAALEAQLAVVAGFENPKVSLEQYPTPPDLAAHLVHLADLRGDIEGTTVLDLGTGTGMLALGAALRSPARVVGVELDPDALETAVDNARRVGASAPIHWIRGDATRLPVSLPDDQPITVLMNPPFGAQRGNEHADRAFLEAVSRVADVSYSVHNEGSKEFVESFVADAGGELTDAFRATFDLERQFDFHDADRRELDAEVFRIEW